MNYQSEDCKKWLKNFRTFSKTKSLNKKVLSVYDVVLRHQYLDSDHWHAGAANEVQGILNSFSKVDWTDLEDDIVNWNIDDQLNFVEAIAFGFDGQFDPALQRDKIPEASELLISLFIKLNNQEIREAIVYFAFFINDGNSLSIEKLVKIKDWMLTNGYNAESWLNSEINPLGNIEKLIQKASR